MADYCKYCGCETTVEMLKARKRKRTENVSAGLLARAAKGLPTGRPKKRDDARIINLRRLGYSIREIAHVLGCSTGSVQAAIKQNAAQRAKD